MKNSWQLIPLLPYIILTALIFYLLPVLSDNDRLFIVLLIVLVPVYCLSSSAFYGFKNGFHWFYPIFVGMMFLPIVFTLLEFLAIIFAFFYSLVSLLGLYLGSQIAKRKHKK